MPTEPTEEEITAILKATRKERMARQRAREAELAAALAACPERHTEIGGVRARREAEETRALTRQTRKGE